jgi:hypothetical protein
VYSLVLSLVLHQVVRRLQQGQVKFHLVLWQRRMWAAQGLEADRDRDELLEELQRASIAYRAEKLTIIIRMKVFMMMRTNEVAVANSVMTTMGIACWAAKTRAHHDLKHKAEHIHSLHQEIGRLHHQAETKAEVIQCTLERIQEETAALLRSTEVEIRGIRASEEAARRELQAEFEAERYEWEQEKAALEEERELALAAVAALQTRVEAEEAAERELERELTEERAQVAALQVALEA